MRFTLSRFNLCFFFDCRFFPDILDFGSGVTALAILFPLVFSLSCFSTDRCPVASCSLLSKSSLFSFEEEPRGSTISFSSNAAMVTVWDFSCFLDLEAATQFDFSGNKSLLKTTCPSLMPLP